MIYLDNSATTKPSAEVLAAVNKVLTDDFGNPSSLYGLGLSAEKTVKSARESVAKSLGCSANEVFFTSCGTEADNWAIKGVWEAKHKQGKRIITTAVEHPAVLRCCEYLERQGADIVYLAPDERGVISLADFEAALTDDTILVSVMHVNNETGAVMPIAEIREIMRKRNSSAYLHSDAVQSYGKLSCDVNKLGVDFLSISGHKVHCPKGIGALYIRNGVHLPVFVHGGGQESGKRSGTENTAGIAAMGAAAQHIVSHQKDDLNTLSGLKKHLQERITNEIEDVKINSPEDGCPSVLNVSFMGCRAEVLLHMLDTEGICVSTGSACSSHTKGSHVLSAMKLTPAEIEGAIRFSFSADNTIEEMDTTAEALKKVITTHRKLMKYHH